VSSAFPFDGVLILFCFSCVIPSHVIPYLKGFTPIPGIILSFFPIMPSNYPLVLQFSTLMHFFSPSTLSPLTTSAVFPFADAPRNRRFFFHLSELLPDVYIRQPLIFSRLVERPFTPLSDSARFFPLLHNAFLPPKPTFPLTPLLPPFYLYSMMSTRHPLILTLRSVL